MDLLKFIRIYLIILFTYPQPIITRLRLPRNNKILNEADITSIKVYHK